MSTRVMETEDLWMVCCIRTERINTGYRQRSESYIGATEREKGTIEHGRKRKVGTHRPTFGH